MNRKLISRSPVDLATLTCETCPVRSYCKTAPSLKGQCLKDCDSCVVEEWQLGRNIVSMVKRFKPDPIREKRAMQVVYKAAIEKQIQMAAKEAI